MTDAKTGEELTIGDVIVYGKDCHTITTIAPHSYNDRRIIESGDWSMTVFNSDQFRKLTSGAWISSHLWFSQERK